MRSSFEAAGYDLRNAEGDIALEPLQRAVIGTGFVIEIPPGLCGMIRPRSGLAANHGLDVLAGVVDSDYRGEVKVVIINFGADKVVLHKGDRIAQMVIHPVYQGVVAETNRLTKTDRAEAGFGSTGVK